MRIDAKRPCRLQRAAVRGFTLSRRSIPWCAAAGPAHPVSACGGVAAVRGRLSLVNRGMAILGIRAEWFGWVGAGRRRVRKGRRSTPRRRPPAPVEVPARFFRDLDPLVSQQPERTRGLPTNTPHGHVPISPGGCEDRGAGPPRLAWFADLLLDAMVEVGNGGEWAEAPQAYYRDATAACRHSGPEFSSAQSGTPATAESTPDASNRPGTPVRQGRAATPARRMAAAGPRRRRDRRPVPCR